MYKRFTFAGFVIFIAAIFGMAANAATITVYTDESAWQAAVGTFETIDFESHTGVVTGSEFSASALSPQFSNQTGTGMVTGPGNSELVPTSGTSLFLPVASAGDPTGALAGDPIGEVRVEFNAPVFALGAFFLDVDLTSSLSGVGFDVTDDGVPDVTFASVPGGDPSQAFLGFVTDMPVLFVDMHIGVSDPSRDGVGIDDLQYAAAEVPEPGMMILFGASVLIVLGRNRQRAK